jgi:hypothetical protein
VSPGALLIAVFMIREIGMQIELKKKRTRDRDFRRILSFAAFAREDSARAALGPFWRDDPVWFDSRKYPGGFFERLGKRIADAGEHGVDGRSDLLNAGYARERDQDNHQCIFDEILTLFAIDQAADFQICALQ